MNVSSTLRNLLVSAGAIASGLLISVPAQANVLENSMLADNHTGDAMMNDSSVGSIAEVASSSASFETLEQALQAAGLVDTLNSGGPYTVFAPTDEAFNQLPDGALEFLLQPENQDLLAQILKYHVVPGSITAEEITPGGISALSGGIAVAVRDSRVIVNNGSVIDANIQASNGVIHAINRVLIPESVQQQLAAALN